MLSQFELNQKTYLSEHALLVGLIKQQFSNRSAIDYFYNEISSLSRNGNSELTKLWLFESLKNIGLDVDVHNFTFKYDKLLNKQEFKGQNIYGIIRSPGAARTQAILITTPLRYGDNNDEPDNRYLLASISMMLALAQHARNKLYWATDIIFLFTEMEYIGMKAWLNAYHGLSDPNDYINHQPLVTRSGSILAGFNLEIASMRVPYLEFHVESLNGQLPNLDLYNTFVRLAEYMEIPVRIHGVPPPISTSMKYRENGLKTFLSMMWYQSSGSPNGLHGLLADFHVPSLTIYSPPLSRASSKTNLFDITKLMESALRSLNGLQERMHQSFFFYLLPSTMNYVSIGMYMLPFGLMCGCGLLFQVIGAINYFQTLFQEADKKEDGDEIKQDEILDWKNLGIVVILSIGFGFLVNWILDYFMIHSHQFGIEPSNGLIYGAISTCLALMLFCKLKVDNYNENSNKCKLEQYKPIGIIGSGNMGTGIIKGLISSKLLNPDDIIATNSRHVDLIKLKSQGVLIENSNAIVAEKSKTIILAVKPGLIQKVVAEIRDFIIGKLLISVASGISIETIQKSIPGQLIPIIRVMPNTAVEVHEGCAAITPSSDASSLDINACKMIFQSICKVCEVVSEDNIDSMIGISGSGIAYIYVVAEALIDAGVKMGLPRNVSNKLVAQTLVGAGKMILETGQHPMQLKDNVTSPGGCTICGVAKLEELGLRNALIQAAEAAKEKAQKH